ncbi:MAG TPA: PstS family phosphate ABC transporter substrate-binding protein [candidate division WOR-3 bacterium]|uniref:Phosphate-binding protein n=1 Tax=candidate division WOR-3 bacterium TaxID=2052148 RepID=A0A7V0T713_UNCW3|nr:PstS family phosphate ABC transporter substrate-binding protein [candidate division WOR-3 bacterium]
MKRFATLAATALLLAGTVQAGELLIKGSDTMLNVTQRLAEAFMAARPDVTVSVTGGGSGVGINSLMNGECDIANASRDMRPKEDSTARAKGIDPRAVVIGIDGLSVIVNEKNPVRKLTMEQVGAIYRGEIKNWNQVGGPNRAISLYGRQPSSGTFVLFRDVTLKGEYAVTMRQMTGTAAIVEAVKQDVGGIGYIGVGYLNEATGIASVDIRGKDGNYYSPLNAQAVYDGRYALSRPLNQYVNGRPSGETRAFFEFALSEAGQKVVEGEGFYPVGGDYAVRNAAVLGN